MSVENNSIYGAELVKKNIILVNNEEISRQISITDLKEKIGGEILDNPIEKELTALYIKDPLQIYGIEAEGVHFQYNKNNENELISIIIEKASSDTYRSFLELVIKYKPNVVKTPLGDIIEYWITKDKKICISIPILCMCGISKA